MYEFTNIERDELPALQMYVKGYLESRSRRQSAKSAVKAEVIDVEQDGSSSSAGAAVVNVDEDDDSDEDDDDYSEGDSDESDDDDSGDSEGNSYNSSGSDDDDDDSESEDEGRGKKRGRGRGNGSDSEDEEKPKKVKKTIAKKVAVKREPETMVLDDSGVMAVDMTETDNAAPAAPAARVTPLPGSVAPRDGRKPNKDSIVKKESNGAAKPVSASVAPSVSSDNLSAAVKEEVNDVEIIPAPKKERIEIEL